MLDPVTATTPAQEPLDPHFQQLSRTARDWLAAGCPQTRWHRDFVAHRPKLPYAVDDPVEVYYAIRTPADGRRQAGWRAGRIVAVNTATVTVACPDGKARRVAPDRVRRVAEVAHGR